MVDTSEFDRLVSYLSSEINKNEFSYNDVKDDAELTKIVASLTRYTEQKLKIGSVYFDSYVVDFDIVAFNDSGTTVGTVSFTTNYPRNDGTINNVTAKLQQLGIAYNYSNPNSGSIWSSLLPLVGVLVIGIVFFFLFRTRDVVKAHFDILVYPCVGFRKVHRALRAALRLHNKDKEHDRDYQRTEYR